MFDRHVKRSTYAHTDSGNVFVRSGTLTFVIRADPSGCTIQSIVWPRYSISKSCSLRPILHFLLFCYYFRCKYWNAKNQQVYSLPNSNTVSQIIFIFVYALLRHKTNSVSKISLVVERGSYKVSRLWIFFRQANTHCLPVHTNVFDRQLCPGQKRFFYQEAQLCNYNL